MDKQSEKHLIKILNDFGKIIDKKYSKGVEQHGGKLWLKSDLIDKAIEEVADLATYLITLKQQIKNKNFGKLKDKDEC